MNDALRRGPTAGCLEEKCRQISVLRDSWELESHHEWQRLLWSACSDSCQSTCFSLPTGRAHHQRRVAAVDGRQSSAMPSFLTTTEIAQMFWKNVCAEVKGDLAVNLRDLGDCWP